MNSRRNASCLERVFELAFDEWVSHVVFSSSGRWSYIGLSNGVVAVLDTLSGEVVAQEPLHEGLLSLRPCPIHDGFACTGQDGFAVVADERLRNLVRVRTEGAWNSQVDWSPDGAMIAVATDRQVQVFDLTGKEIWQSHDFGSTVSDLVFSQRESWLAVAAYGGVTFLDATTGVRGSELPWKGSLLRLSLSPDEKYLAGGGQDKTVHFWRLESGADSAMYGYQTKPLILRWHPEGPLLVTSGSSVATVWSFSGAGPENTTPVQLPGHVDTITDLAFVPNTRLLLTASLDRRVFLWDMSTQRRVSALDMSGAVTSMAVSASGLVVAGDAHGEVVIAQLS